MYTVLNEKHLQKIRKFSVYNVHLSLYNKIIPIEEETTMKNDYLLELLEELKERNFDYKIENGWFEITLGNRHYNFSITDEDETAEMLDALWFW